MSWGRAEPNCRGACRDFKYPAGFPKGRQHRRRLRFPEINASHGGGVRALDAGRCSPCEDSVTRGTVYGNSGVKPEHLYSGQENPNSESSGSEQMSEDSFPSSLGLWNFNPLPFQDVNTISYINVSAKFFHNTPGALMPSNSEFWVPRLSILWPHESRLPAFQ